MKHFSHFTGDFFIDELPKADLYILVRILHDLTEEKLHILLSKIAAACTPGNDPITLLPFYGDN